MFHNVPGVPPEKMEHPYPKTPTKKAGQGFITYSHPLNTPLGARTPGKPKKVVFPCPADE
jgi:hypothetical protein